MLDKFKDNFFSLSEALEKNDLLNFMIEKKAFKEEFVKIVSESNELNKLSNVRKNKTKNFKKKNYIFDIKKIDNDYIVGYDKEQNKITVNISKNSIFSYYDDKIQLKEKLDRYINEEEYEKASIIYNYIKKCEIIF